MGLFKGFGVQREGCGEGVSGGGVGWFGAQNFRVANEVLVTL